jgi:Ni,Fe-hydrogenase maturation factor
MRTFIGGIGSRDSAEDSIGIQVSERLAADAPIHAARVVVEPVRGDAAELAAQLNGEWPQFERVILVGSVTRERTPGSVTAYRWDGEIPNEAIAAGADGDVTAEDDCFDSMLLRVRELVDRPAEFILVEVEPEVSRGRQADAAAMERARILVRRLATNARAAAELPVRALGAPASARDR